LPRERFTKAAATWMMPLYASRAGAALVLPDLLEVLVRFVELAAVEVAATLLEVLGHGYDLFDQLLLAPKGSHGTQVTGKSGVCAEARGQAECPYKPPRSTPHG
jgi:hypothetical protein